ncbi:MAG: hypothetical protein AB8H86_21070 [Polyangiales bacterium]
MIRLLTIAFVALVVMPVHTARAESWCAYPLWAHEWGVQSFDGQGVPVAATLPPWFHRSASTTAGRSAVRDMPVDGGERALPVLHFYSNGTLSPNSIPVGIEVGFRRGAATVWYPQVQGIRSAAQANSSAALAARQRLVAARAARTPMGGGPYATLDRDPTRQLFWDRLDLSAQPARSAHSSTQAWINTARGFDALWVNGAQESERFVFYEGATRERPLVSLERGSRYSANRRHIVLHNRSAYPVHDTILTHRENGRVYVAHIPRIPAGRRAGFILEEHLVSGDVDSQTRGRLRQTLVDTSASAPATSQGECPMMRDPAIPVESAVSHRLYDAEVELILQTWGAAFFDGPGTTLVYREDTTYLDAMLPISLYTDMYNDIVLHRASLAVQRGITLP